MVLLGSGEGRYETSLTDAARRHPTRLAVRLGFDEGLAHRIEGGADAFLMPSRYEPCGLNQMMSMRYGTLPVVRATGGLADTVMDFDPATGKGTGFAFEPYTPGAMVACLERAVAAYRDSSAWRRLQVSAMKQDFSWEASAKKYEEAYAGAQERLGARQPHKS